jgi:uncharacterized protein YneF (UPF0154 family)
MGGSNGYIDKYLKILLTGCILIIISLTTGVAIGYWWACIS